MATVLTNSGLTAQASTAGRDGVDFGQFGAPQAKRSPGTKSLRTLRWREPNSNLHSLSYDLPRTELDRVGRRTQICAATSFLAPSCSSFPFSKPPIPACARSETSARVLQGCGFGYAHMLGTNADPNQPGRKDRNCALASTIRLTMPNRSKVLRASRSIRVTAPQYMVRASLGCTARARTALSL